MKTDKETPTTFLDAADKLPKPVLIFLSILTVFGLGCLDYLTGFESPSSIFYLLPIIIVAWSAGAPPAVFISVLSAGTWLAADLLSGHVYQSSLIPFWNSVMVLGFFLMFALLIAENRRNLVRESMMALTDSLTKIANGRRFYQLAREEMNRAKRSKRPLALAYIDVDNFKEVNDVYGHGRGDELLCSVADTLKKNIRSTDAVARLGGDEFAVLLPETGEEESVIVSERVKDSLMEAVRENQWPVTFSIGVVVYNLPVDDVDEMVSRADALMYSVKNGGKNDIKYEVLEFNSPT